MSKKGEVSTSQDKPQALPSTASEGVLESKEDKLFVPDPKFGWGNVIAVLALLLSLFNTISPLLQPKLVVQETRLLSETSPNAMSFTLLNEGFNTTGQIEIIAYSCRTDLEELTKDFDAISLDPPYQFNTQYEGRQVRIIVPNGIARNKTLEVNLLIQPVYIYVLYKNNEKTLSVETNYRGGCI